MATNTEALAQGRFHPGSLGPMYTEHFRLQEPPFSIAPNPRYLFLSPPHREALAHLLYGIGVGGGFVVLSGEVGMGKTTLCRALLDQLPEDVEIALVFNPRLNSKELLATICDELRIPYGGIRASLKQLIDALNAHLLDAHARGQRVIVLIDEAQNLRFDVLEQVRLLTNLETNQTKLLQIILVGQPELNEILDRPNLRQLAQRITARYHLEPLSSEATGEYIRHRIGVAGGREDLFKGSAIREIYRRSAGIPRLINLLGDRALLGAYTLGLARVDGKIVRQAALELRGTGVRRQRPGVQMQRWLVSGVGLLLVLGLALILSNQLQRSNLWAPLARGFNFDLPLDEATSLKSTARSTDVPDAQGLQGGTDLSAYTGSSGRLAAIHGLFSLWGSRSEASDPCKTVNAAGLHCQNYRGSWERLLRLNLPAVIAIRAAEGPSDFLLLTEVRGDRALVRGRTGETSLSLLQLKSLWEGHAILVYRPPVNDRRALRVGAMSPMVPWIRAQLGDEGGTTVLDPGRYDEALRDRVKSFQETMDLRPDGLVGALTLIALQGNGVAKEVPRLIPKAH